MSTPYSFGQADRHSDYNILYQSVYISMG